MAAGPPAGGLGTVKYVVILMKENRSFDHYFGILRGVRGSVMVKPGRSRTVVHSAADAHGWYDLEVTTDGGSPFRRRLMGHIENGRPSVSG